MIAQKTVGCLGGEWLACSPRERKVLGSTHGRVKLKTLKMVFAASPLSTQHLGGRAKTGGSRVRIMCPWPEIVHGFSH